MNDEYSLSSRYRGLPIRIRLRADGTEERFVTRRIIPGLERYRILDRYRTDGRERIDSVAAAVFGDPELYWRICDANGDPEPAEATSHEGSLLVIPMPLEVSTDADA